MADSDAERSEDYRKSLSIRQNLLAALPQVMQEATKIGQEWGQKIGKQAAGEAEQEVKKTSPTRS